MAISSDKGEATARPRKPYVMSRPRETWSEREHHLFVEALKLYTRDWKKIQGHIGTKTAVQIRSHAQKYFQKQVKEGNAASVPPPRAKRQAGTVPRGKSRRRAASGASLAAALSDEEADPAVAAAAARAVAQAHAAAAAARGSHRSSADDASCAGASDSEVLSGSSDGLQSPRHDAAGAPHAQRPARKRPRTAFTARAGQTSSEDVSRGQQREAAETLGTLDQRPDSPASERDRDNWHSEQPLNPGPVQWGAPAPNSFPNGCGPQMQYPQTYYGAAGYPSWQQLCKAGGVPTAPPVPKQPPNYAVVYSFLGGLFDGGADGDAAAALAAMGPNTRETAWLCLRNLAANMQAPAWQQQMAAPCWP